MTTSSPQSPSNVSEMSSIVDLGSESDQKDQPDGDEEEDVSSPNRYSNDSELLTYDEIENCTNMQKMSDRFCDNCLSSKSNTSEKFLKHFKIIFIFFLIYFSDAKNMCLAYEESLIDVSNHFIKNSPNPHLVGDASKLV